LNDLETALQIWASIQRNELDHGYPREVPWCPLSGYPETRPSPTESDYEAAEIVSKGIVKMEHKIMIAEIQTLIYVYGAYPEARHESKDERIKVLSDVYGEKRWPGLLKGARQFLNGFLEART